MTDKKVALITGANKGIGFETARQLGEKGYTVLLGARDEARGREAETALKANGVDAHFVHLDVNDPATHKSAAAFVEENYGKLDALVNNAGIMPDDGVSASDGTYDQWKTTFDTNVFNLVALTQGFLPLVKKSDAGRIVNLTSILGSLAMNSSPDSPLADWVGLRTAYCASKAALNMFTIHLAKELRDANVKVNSAHPGWVKTDMGGAEAPLEIVDGAKTSVELATLPADGPSGKYIHMGEELPW